jgi:hypothetical protein
MVKKSDNRRRASRERFVSMRLRYRMRVRGGLGINRKNVFHEDFSHDIGHAAFDGRFLIHKVPTQHAIFVAG